MKIALAILTFQSALLYAWEPLPIDFNETVIKIKIKGHIYYVTQAWHDPECPCSQDEVTNANHASLQFIK